jgi:hypothetical protein
MNGALKDRLLLMDVILESDFHIFVITGILQMQNYSTICAKKIFWFYGVTLVQTQLEMAQINIINECGSQRLNGPRSVCDYRKFRFAELKIKIP